MELKLEKANLLVGKKVEYPVGDGNRITAIVEAVKICEDRVLVYCNNNHSINYDIIREILEVKNESNL